MSIQCQNSNSKIQNVLSTRLLRFARNDGLDCFVTSFRSVPRNDECGEQ